MAILFHTEDINFSFKGRQTTKQWIKSTAEEEGCKTGDINIVFCSNKYILETNNQYLSHNYYTDIITFDDSVQGRKYKTLSGDLIISIDTVRDNSAEYGISFENELQRVIIHGILHLCGYPDKKPDEAKVMRAKENYYLAKFYNNKE